MKRFLNVAMVLIFGSLAACAPKTPTSNKSAKSSTPSPQVIPVPREFSVGTGVFRIDAQTSVIHSGGEGARLAAERFVELSKLQTEVTLGAPVEKAAGSKAISFALTSDGKAGAEAYSLDISPKSVRVTAQTPAGLFYGAITLWQLMTAAPANGGIVELPGLKISDAPRFAWRGLMLDSARYYQSPEFIKQFIDWMALHKLNVFHWHLTDDQGWRIEIKKYPRLTSVGAWRVPAGAASLADIDEQTGKPRQIGGFYTQEQVREVVAYAATRHIRVIPEIEMPGHASAAIAAYPKLSVFPEANKNAKVPADWGVYEALFNVEESTFGFLEDVMAEVIQLFPDEYVHVGGDEAVKVQWESSPRVRARMKELGVKDAHELQSYFIQRMGTYLDAHGRRLIGWDEVLEGGLAPNATVMSWRGIDGAIAAAKAGHDTVLSPAPDLYFDHWQSAGDLAPGRSNTLSLEMVYAFNPIPASIPEAQRSHILGLQANLWAEFMRTDKRVEYMTFPRIAALAEVAWSPEARIGWPDFQRRLEMQLKRYDSLGITYAREAQLKPAARRRLSHDLEQCGDGYLLSLEDDAPVEGERAVFLVNISNPCWLWRGADLTKVKSLRATIGQIPFNFQIGKDAAKIPLPKPRSADGELEIRLDGCEGTPIASAPLTPAVSNNRVTVLPPVSLEGKTGTHDLCFIFTRAKVDPIWVIDNIELVGN
jgi:hexosaminidase